MVAVSVSEETVLALRGLVTLRTENPKIAETLTSKHIGHLKLAAEAGRDFDHLTSQREKRQKVMSEGNRTV